jgi:NitT/TauT family transport system substrate-binding protein
MRRRALLRSGLALGGGLIGGGFAAACASATPGGSPNSTLGPPETTAVRIVSVACDPALWSADDYLREEGFNPRILPLSVGAVARGEGEVGVGYSQWVVANLDAGKSIQSLAGLHTGCGEVWTKPGISSIRDLKGRTIDVGATDAVLDPWYGVWASMFAYVGIDARKDVNFVADPNANTVERFVQGRSDAILALSNQVPILRASAKNPGKLLIDMHVDGTWSRYYCCQLIVNRDWAQQNPNATKRVTRALLRANDRVAKDPAAAVLAGVNAGMFMPELFDTVLATLKNCTFEWRELDVQDSLLFNAVQLSGQKLVKGTPQQLVERGSSFGYLTELKRQFPRAN